MPGRPALFLDRDGVINEDRKYLHRIEECRFVDGIFTLARDFRRRGFALVVVTNQSGIGRGLYGEAEYQLFTDWIRAEFAREGAPLDAVHHCPDHPTEGIGPYRRENPRRKPGPGMILDAAAELGLDLGASWLVGDKESDLAAGRAAGVGRLVLLDPTAPELREAGDHWVAPGHDAIRALLADVAGPGPVG